MGLVSNYISVLLWTAFTFIVFHHSAAAQTSVVLNEYETRNLVFSGYLGEKTDMPVTFCLNVENRSFGHVDWYSVSGWYQYDRHEIPIPLAGMFTGDLTLYRFAEEESTDSLLHFLHDDYEQYSFMQMMGLYHEMEGFQEKITIEHIYDKFENSAKSGRTLKGEWTDGEKQLSLRVSRTDVAVLQRHSFLQIHHNGIDFRINLNNLNLPLFHPGDHSIAGYKVVDGKIRVVLFYNRMSKPYVLGACGAANETGFLWLELDEKGNLLGLKDYLIVSCLKNVYSEPGYQGEDQENYIVTDGEGLGWFLYFDKKTMELKWEEGG